MRCRQLILECDAVTIAGGPPGAHDPFEEADYAPARYSSALLVNQTDIW